MLPKVASEFNVAFVKIVTHRTDGIYLAATWGAVVIQLA